MSSLGDDEFRSFIFGNYSDWPSVLRAKNLIIDAIATTFLFFIAFFTMMLALPDEDTKERSTVKLSFRHLPLMALVITCTLGSIISALVVQIDNYYAAIETLFFSLLLVTVLCMIAIPGISCLNRLDKFFTGLMNKPSRGKPESLKKLSRYLDAEDIKE